MAKLAGQGEAQWRINNGIVALWGRALRCEWSAKIAKSSGGESAWMSDGRKTLYHP
jgi:hypothetical protein